MQIENEHDKAIAYHDTIAPKMEEKSSKKSYSSSDITIERSIYFFYWLFKFARSVVVKSRSAFLLSLYFMKSLVVFLPQSIL